MYTVSSPNCGHFGTQASVFYSESVLYLGVRVISASIHVVITAIIFFDIRSPRYIILRLPCMSIKHLDSIEIREMV